MIPINIKPAPQTLVKWVAICAVWGALIGMLWTAQPSMAQTPTPPSAHEVVSLPGEYKGPEYCGSSGCHPQEYSQWKMSRHSVYSIAPGTCTTCHGIQNNSSTPAPQPSTGLSQPTPTSQADTAMHSKGGSCAACHTTGYDPVTGRSIAEGVTCEACHGLSEGNHPPDKVKVTDAASFCGTCHQPSYAEWQMSGHGKRDIKCTACHAVHSQRLQFEDTNGLCANCHNDRYSDFAHSSHSSGGLNCASCHIYRVASRSEMGRAPTGHTFLVTSNVCANCHKDTIHQRSEIPDLENRISQLQDLIPHDTIDQANNLQKQVSALERSRLEALGGGIGGGALVGAIAGAGVVSLVARRKRSPTRSSTAVARAESKKEA